MAEVLFYHLEREGPEAALPLLLEKTIARGWRALVAVGDDEARGALDQALWSYRDESFLPHGVSDDPRQPIWLTDAEGAERDGYDVLFLTHGAAVPPERFGGFTRTVLMFTGEEAPAAREVWKAVKAANHEATYWKQNAAGRWEKAA